MSHDLPVTVELYERLRQVDEELVDEVRRRGCGRCGGRLDRADFPRKPRGVPPEAEVHLEKRFGLCCSAEGCRRRTLPPSVRFLGRRVYVAVAIVVACIAEATRCGWQEARRVGRWLAWWRVVFPASAIFAEQRGRLATPVTEADLPKALFDRFEGKTAAERMPPFLRFVAGVSPGHAHEVRGSPVDTQSMVLGKVDSSE